jgi:hypothetical protein
MSALSIVEGSRLISIVWLLCACSSYAAPSHAQTPSNSTLDVPSIVTTGEAIVKRAPDRAYVTIAVETRAARPRDAQRQNAEAMTAVQQRIAAAGIPKDAVQTLGYTVQQEFDYVSGKRVSRGYVARNAVDVRIDAVERTGDLLDAVVEGGATTVAGIRFDLRDRAGAEREALRLAVADARARAEAAAAGAGRSIDRILRIEDRERVSPIPMPMVAMRGAAQAGAPPPPPIEAGEIEIRAQVTLTVSIK